MVNKGGSDIGKQHAVAEDLSAADRSPAAVNAHWPPPINRLDAAVGARSHPLIRITSN